MKHRILGIVWLLASGANAVPKDQIEPGPLSAALEDYQVPAPDWSAIVDAKIKAGLPLPEWPVCQPAPLDRVSPETHLEYWRESWARKDGRKPSPVAQRKILEALQYSPAAATDVLPVLPTDMESVKSVAALIDKLPDSEPWDKSHRCELRAWVYLHGGLLRARVFDDARLSDWQLHLSSEMKANPQSGELIGPAEKPAAHPAHSTRPDPHPDIHLQHVDVFDDDAKIVYSAIAGDLVRMPQR